MYMKDMLVMRIKLIALSQIRNIEDSVKRNPMAYRKDTMEYCEANVSLYILYIVELAKISYNL
uniref:hypothetical protein n=1 Tax=Mitsuokella jalaludinii TaxID=187979 RepID=UPI00307CA3CD